MSIWTQVNGNIRVDGSIEIDELKKKLGKIVKYRDKDWDTTLPLGSEGSIEYNIYTDPSESSICSYVVSIFGSLRNYDDELPIENWFRDVCKDLWVRQAILQVDIWSKSYILKWCNSTEEIVKTEL